MIPLSERGYFQGAIPTLIAIAKAARRWQGVLAKLNFTASPGCMQQLQLNSEYNMWQCGDGVAQLVLLVLHLAFHIMTHIMTQDIIHMTMYRMEPVVIVIHMHRFKHPLCAALRLTLSKGSNRRQGDYLHLRSTTIN